MNAPFQPRKILANSGVVPTILAGMGNGHEKPPQSARELLERYAAGKRDFRGAYLRKVDLTDANLARANLRARFPQGYAYKSQGMIGPGANLADANLEAANLAGVDLAGANLRGAKLAGANLAGANLESANLVDAEVTDANFDNADLSHGNLGHNADLLAAEWTTLKIGDKTYHRDAVERGEEALPFGMGPRLSILIETARLRGTKRDAAMIVADYVASAAPEVNTEVIDRGGSNTWIRFSVASRENATVLLQVGDGFCRLLDHGTGVQNALPQESRPATAQDIRTLQKAMDDKFEPAARRTNIMLDDILDALERIGREDLKSVKLTGFSDADMEALQALAQLGSEYFEIKFIEDKREAMLTVTQQVTRDLYEWKIAKPLRTLIEALFVRSKPAKCEDNQLIQ